MNYNTLRKLIDHFEAFEKETGQGDLPAFALWLQDRYPGREAVPVRPAGEQAEKKEHAVATYNRYGDYNGQIAHAVGTLYQHARHYIKTALQDLPLKGLHDFTFLATLTETPDMRKSDLIARNMLEFSPGMEVIRRLLRRSLIEDYEDPEDARSRRVRLSPEGRQVFLSALGQMIRATEIVGGNLSKEEKVQFLVIARKLLHFHQPIWEHDLGRPLAEIREKYLEAEQEA